MRTRTVPIVATVMIGLLPLAACSNDSETLPEPPVSAQPEARNREDTTDRDSAGPTHTVTETIEETSEDRDEAEETELELAPGEQTLEGTVMKIQFKDMVTPDVYDQVKDQIDGDKIYFALKLDPIGPIEGDVAAGVLTTREPEWAIVGGWSSNYNVDWSEHEGKRARVIARPEQLQYGSDIAIPPSAVVVYGSDYEPQILD